MQSLEQLRIQSAQRQAARAERTPQQQIAVLDHRLGKNDGAGRERAKLLALMEKKHKVPAPEPAEAGQPEEPKKKKKKVDKESK